MEIYQWLLRNQGLKVSDTAYFVYCNADKSKEVFDATLKFPIEIIPYQVNAGWVEPAIIEAHKCLISNDLPDYSKNCEYCHYRKATQELEGYGAPGERPNIQRELF